MRKQPFTFIHHTVQILVINIILEHVLKATIIFHEWMISSYCSCFFEGEPEKKHENFIESFNLVELSLYQWWLSVAYLGFQNGGAKFLLATSAHTKEGQTKFFNFSYCEKKNFAKGGPWPKGPPKYATDGCV